MRSHHSLGLGLSFLLLATIVPVGPGAAVQVEAVALPVLAAFDECLVCTHGDCESGDHLAWDMDGSGIEVWTRNGGAHLDGLCRSGDCDSKHGPTCIIIEGAPLVDADLEVLRSAIASGDRALLNSLIAAHPSQIAINPERAAVQVSGCNGSIVAHLPLPPTP